MEVRPIFSVIASIVAGTFITLFFTTSFFPSISMVEVSLGSAPNVPLKAFLKSSLLISIGFLPAII